MVRHELTQGPGKKGGMRSIHQLVILAFHSLSPLLLWLSSRSSPKLYVHFFTISTAYFTLHIRQTGLTTSRTKRIAIPSPRTAFPTKIPTLADTGAYSIVITQLATDDAEALVTWRDS